MLKISEAASLALHTMVFLAANSTRLVANKEIASILKVSPAHLSKVLQRLAKMGLVNSIRGPKGGFRLGKIQSSITLLEVYEAIEGPLLSCSCLMNEKVCTKQLCILDSLLEDVNKQVKEYFHCTTLDQLTLVYPFLDKSE